MKKRTPPPDSGEDSKTLFERAWTLLATPNKRKLMKLHFASPAVKKLDEETMSKYTFCRLCAGAKKENLVTPAEKDYPWVGSRRVLNFL